MYNLRENQYFNNVLLALLFLYNFFEKFCLCRRYHLEEDQQYGQFSAGKISRALKEALGLRKNELPSYIYRMRVLGYPPGWLEEAKCIYSNLDMFDADGKTVKQKSERKKQGLNPEKIIEYSGFNTPLQKNFRDVS